MRASKVPGAGDFPPMVFEGKYIETPVVPKEVTQPPPPPPAFKTPPPPPPEVKPIIVEKKKSHFFRKLFLLTFGLTAIAYAGGVYYSLDDDNFRDIFTENVPLAEDIIYFIEEQRFKRRFSDKLPTINSKTDAPPSLTSSKSTTVSRSGASPKPVDTEIKAPQEAAAPSAPPAHAKPNVTSATAQSIPKAQLPLIRITEDMNPTVEKSIEGINNFITLVNESKASPSDIEELSKVILELNSSIVNDVNKLSEAEVAKIEQKYEASLKEIKTAVSAQEEKWSRDFHEETKRLTQAYNERLQNEVNAAQRVIFAHANNRLLAVHAEREKEFAKQISERVEKERNGRLSKLEEINKELQNVKELVSKASKAIEESNKASKYQLAVARLRLALDAEEPVPLEPYFSAVRNIDEKDEFISSVLSAVPKEALSQGVLSPAQIAARFHLLEPEIRNVSLLPPNAGVFGHLGSMVFSKLLWKKSGNATGDDVEAVLARADTALSEGRIVDAVAEVNSLKGWPKRLAHDWLAEGRKRSEVEFLANLLAEEGKLWA